MNSDDKGTSGKMRLVRNMDSNSSQERTEGNPVSHSFPFSLLKIALFPAHSELSEQYLGSHNIICISIWMH